VSNKIKWLYQPNQMQKAAKFIFKKNKFLNKSRAEIEQDINNTIKYGIMQINKGQDCNFISTGGWTIMFSIDDDKYGTIQILVDPSISKQTEYKKYIEDGPTGSKTYSDQAKGANGSNGK
jgi:hypothetical protein